VIPHTHYPRRLQARTVGDTAASYSLLLDMYGQRQEQADFHFFGEYYTELTLGSPGRTYRLQLDTGSAALVIPGPECNDCGTGLRRYDWHKSSTASPIGCATALCTGYCQPGVCDPTLGAVCTPDNNRSTTGSCNDQRARELPQTAVEACRDDDDWVDDLFGSGTAGCNSGESGGVVNNREWCSGQGDYSADAQLACPKACGVCTPAAEEGCAKYRMAAGAEWCGEGDSLERCPASCGRCGRCCTVDQHCFFVQTYADQTAGGGALVTDLLRLRPLGGAQEVVERVVIGQVGVVRGVWEPQGVDGILGIGYSFLNCHPTCTTSPVRGPGRPAHTYNSCVAACIMSNPQLYGLG
jgi:hypothetical protein